jgi:hypothetical protein
MNQYAVSLVYTSDDLFRLSTHIILNSSEQKAIEEAEWFESISLLANDEKLWTLFISNAKLIE